MLFMMLPKLEAGQSTNCISTAGAYRFQARSRLSGSGEGRPGVRIAGDAGAGVVPPAREDHSHTTLPSLPPPTPTHQNGLHHHDRRCHCPACAGSPDRPPRPDRVLRPASRRPGQVKARNPADPGVAPTKPVTRWRWFAARRQALVIPEIILPWSPFRFMARSASRATPFLHAWQPGRRRRHC